MQNNQDFLYPLSCDLVGHENQKIKFICVENDCQAQYRTICLQCQHDDKHLQHKLCEYQEFVKYAKQKKNPKEFDLELNALNRLIKELQEIQELFISQTQQYQTITLNEFDNLTNTRNIIKMIFEFNPYKVCQDLQNSISQSQFKFSTEMSKRKEEKKNNFLTIIPYPAQPIKEEAPIEQVVPPTINKEQMTATIVEKLRQKAAQQYLVLQFQDSLFTINKALELDPNNILCMKRKCDILVKFERYDEALKICDFAIGIENKGLWHSRKADIYGYQGNKQKRIEELKEACRLNPFREKYSNELKKEESGEINIELLGQRFLQQAISYGAIKLKKNE